MKSEGVYCLITSVSHILGDQIRFVCSVASRDVLSSLNTLQIVLKEFSLEVPAGEVTALCGLSGAGEQWNSAQCSHLA